MFFDWLSYAKFLGWKYLINNISYWQVT